MNYDSVILEMLTRIQALEDKVSALEDLVSEVPGNGVPEQAAPLREGARISTGEIRAYIRQLLREAAESGEEALVLRSGSIHRALGLSSRMPQVCNAMRQCMREGDRVLFETPSGYSSTLKIQYLPRKEYT